MRLDIFGLGRRSDGAEMSDVAMDPAIKLFGRAIPAPEASEGSGEAASELPETAGGEREVCREVPNMEARNLIPDVPEESEGGEPPSSSGLENGSDEDHQTSPRGDIVMVDSKPEQNRNETNASGQEKVLKKPDKILPCPRCNSMDTKFCYYNNYNVNQPRHFCKSCQRYWTAGGAMRNVPVGAGRRKSKHSSAHCRHIMKSSDGMACNQVDAPDSCNHQTVRASLSAPVRPLMGNEHVVKFGLEAPLCESMTSVLNLGDQKRNAKFGSSACGENKEELSCTSSIMASKCEQNDLPETTINMKQNGIEGSPNGLIPVHLPCYVGPAWSYPQAPAWTNVASMGASLCSPELVPRPENGGPIPVPWCPPLMATPSFCPTIPFPFVPAAFWGGIPSWPNGTLNVPVPGSNGGLSPPSSTSSSAFSGNSSPALGKHSRDAALQGEEETEKSLWVPKTLRIDDPDEAAKSSIWATLGINPKESVKEGGMFKSFDSKNERKGFSSEAAHVLHANPAALSRSQTFQEST